MYIYIYIYIYEFRCVHRGIGGRVGRVAPQLAIALFLYDSITQVHPTP